MEMELDRISNLPNEVTGQILSRLTITEAVRTSVLSTNWRYMWATLPDLVFDCNFEYTSDFEVARIVDHVLLNHNGPIHKFELDDVSVASSDIDRWILYLSRNSNVKHFKRGTSEDDHLYKMPLCFYSFNNIIQLDLDRCLLKPPSTFKGFRSLKILRLVCVDVAQDVLENMIGGSPLLEQLDLIRCKGLSKLKIDASNLQLLLLRGSFEDVSIVNMFNLIDVDISISPTERGVRCSSNSFLKFFVHMPHIRSLLIHVKYFAVASLLKKIPSPFLDLKFLMITMCFRDLDEILTALFLLRSSPSLEKLEIDAFDGRDHRTDGAAASSWLDDSCICSFPQLRHVEINFITGIEAELDFIRFLLSNSPMLETVTVDPGKFDPLTNSLNLVKKLLRFRRASPNLEILYIGQ